MWSLLNYKIELNQEINPKSAEAFLMTLVVTVFIVATGFVYVSPVVTAVPVQSSLALVEAASLRPLETVDSAALKIEERHLTQPVKVLEITSVTPVPTLIGDTQTFSWSSVPNAIEYRVSLGSNPGGGDIYKGSTGTDTSVTISKIPQDGRLLILRVWYKVDGWRHQDFGYNAKYIPPTPSITVVKPNGGEKVVVGRTLPIRWKSVAVSGNVQIGIIDTRFSSEAGDRAEQIIASSTPNSGGFMWMVPKTIGTMDLTVTRDPVYKIIVHAWNVASLSDASDAPFSIVYASTTAPVTSSPRGDGRNEQSVPSLPGSGNYRTDR